MNIKAIEKLKDSYIKKHKQICERLVQFQHVFEENDDLKLFEELSFCILTAATSAKMSLNAVEAIKNILHYGKQNQISQELKKVYRFPYIRAEYIVHTREYLKNRHNLRIKDLLNSLQDPIERRDYFANDKDIKGLGYKETSHFLRNIGFRGYAILDKHILVTLNEIGLINDSKPPANRSKYLEIERKLIDFSREIEINIDELDLLIWSEKTGEILK